MGTTGLETAFAALHTELVAARASSTLGLLVERMTAGARAVRPADAADRARASRPTSRSSTSTRSGWSASDGYESRSENCCFAGRALRGRVLLTRRRRRASPTASARSAR